MEEQNGANKNVANRVMNIVKNDKKTKTAPKHHRKNTKTAGKIDKYGGKAINYAGKGMSVAGKGVSAAGEGLSSVGNALNSTGAGAVLGAPLAAAGAAINAAGKGISVAGKGVSAAGKGVEKAGNTINNITSANDAAEQSLKKGLKVALRIFTKMLSSIMSILFPLVGVILLIMVVIIVVLCAPLIILEKFGIGNFFGGHFNFDFSGVGSGEITYSTTTYLQQINDECKTIILEDKAYELEEYVKGVVSAEADTSQNIEALKAQAIVARTYAIQRSNMCTKSLRNGSEDQNFTLDYVDSAVEATEATKGLVLTYDSNVFLSEYDSFYTGGDYTINDDGYSVTYTKQPSGEQHIVTINKEYGKSIAGGHGRGMSQIASYQLADEGKNFNYILKYFYSDNIQINSLSGISGYVSGLSGESNGNFTIRVSSPINDNDHDKQFWFSNKNVSYAGNYIGQCTWYVVGRVNEILSEVGSELRLEWAPNAKDWYQTNINQGANAFSYSSNVNEPKVGAIIVWNGEFGHVAIVESVDKEAGTIDYTEANINSVRDAISNPYGWRYVKGVSYTETGVGTISNIWNGYDFIGYIYSIE